MKRERMIEIGRLIDSQDNRYTADPMFIVQHEVYDWGVDPDYSHDGCQWVNEDDAGLEASTVMANRLDALEADGRDTHGWKLVYYRKRWEYVTSCFTEQGCKDYLAINRHNISGRVRIYADGSFRNFEFQDVRKYLVELHSREWWKSLKEMNAA